MFLLLGVSFLTDILISIPLTAFFPTALSEKQRARENSLGKKRQEHAVNIQFINLYDGWVSINWLHAVRAKNCPPMIILCLIYIYLTWTLFILGKIQIQLMLNTKQHKAQMYAEMLLLSLALLSFAFSSCIR